MTEMSQSALMLLRTDFSDLYGLYILVPVAAVVVALVLYIISNQRYKECSYYRVTGVTLSSMWFDPGRRGEYLTYKQLSYFENYGARFLFNVYIPKSNGRTTEIDVLMLTAQGIFVFESKNYSGWIFGREERTYWYQTLPSRRGSTKTQFYNPIMQNRSHVKHLRSLVGDKIPMYSVIVFSDRCTFKDLMLNGDVRVIHRFDVADTVARICSATYDRVLTATDIAELYRKLYPYTQVSEAEKIAHAYDVQNDRQNDSYCRRCPRCGGRLVIRTASRGVNAGNKFFGCSNFPRCRYTENL